MYYQIEILYIFLHKVAIYYLLLQVHGILKSSGQRSRIQGSNQFSQQCWTECLILSELCRTFCLFIGSFVSGLTFRILQTSVFVLSAYLIVSCQKVFFKEKQVFFLVLVHTNHTFSTRVCFTLEKNASIRKYIIEKIK